MYDAALRAQHPVERRENLPIEQRKYFRLKAQAALKWVGAPREPAGQGRRKRRERGSAAVQGRMAER